MQRPAGTVSIFARLGDRFRGAGWKPACAGAIDRARAALAQPVDGAGLAMFRIAFGLIMLWEAFRYLWPVNGLNRLQKIYLEPGWSFPYHGFEWVRPLPEPWLTVVFVVFGLAGLCLALGVCYRASALTLAITLVYIFLLDEAYYLNHFYLMCLLGFLLIWMPAQRCWSIDSWLGRGQPAPPTDGPPGTVPFWPVFLLRFQLFVVYFYGGIAKFDADWHTGAALWGTASKSLGWLDPVLGPEGMRTLERWVSYQDLAWFLAIGGLAFDLGIGFMLIWRRTRILALVLCAMFHGFNSQAFSIGVFPLLAFTGSLIFCEPDWPRRVGRWLKRPRLARPDWAWLVPGIVAVPLAGAALGWRVAKAAPIAVVPGGRTGRLLSACIACWLAFHLLWPLRHYAIPGDANWTEEGHRFSWRMMLRSKEGYLQFTVFDPALFVTDATGKVDLNWAEWTRREPKVVHKDIDATNVNWSRLPELVVVFEPLIGERILLNHRAEGYGSEADARERLEAGWLAAYGQRPEFHPTVSLVEALEAIRGRVENDVSADGDDRATFLEQLRLVRERAAVEPTSLVEAERRSIEISTSLQALLRDERRGPLVHAELARSHPFSLQGAEHAGLSFLAVEDPGLQTVNQHGRWRLDRARWRHAEEVHLDMARIGHEGWQSLPKVLVYYQEGHPRLEWNYHRELIVRQTQTMQQQPFMAHQYAQRIAQLWQEEFGRRPQIYAPTSLVSFNHRLPQPILDPATDLAGTPMKVFFGHNDWMLPLEPNRRRLGEPIVRVEEHDEEEASLDRPRYEAVSIPTQAAATWYPHGQKRSEQRSERRDGTLCSTTTVWTEEGRVLLQADYVNGLQHGFARRWHRNGRLATEVGYHFGKRQGQAAIWYENGAKSWEGEFDNGQRVGLATGFYGDGRIAEQAEFQDGQLVRHILGGDDDLARQPGADAGQRMR